MKKYISFLILFIPWLFTLFIIPFNTTINNLLCIFIFIFISLIFYFFITLFLHKLVCDNEYNKDLLLGIVLLYIFNQYFNANIFYYKNFYLSFVLCFCQLISYLYIFKKVKNT